MVPWTSKGDAGCMAAELMQEADVVQEVVTVEEEEEEGEDHEFVKYLEELAVFACQFITSTVIHDKRVEEESLPWKLDTLCFQFLLLGLQFLVYGARHVLSDRKSVNFRDHWTIVYGILGVLFLLVFVIMPIMHGISFVWTFVSLLLAQILARLLVRGTRIVITAPWRSHIHDKIGLVLLAFVLMYVLAWLPQFMHSLYSYAQFTCLCMRPIDEEHVFP